MRVVTPDEIVEIIRLHGLWRRGEEGGERANLRGANLSDADLSDVNLSGANLSDANLSGVNLSGANLRDADLSGVNLRDADLLGANLRGVNLSDADFSDADLRGANLSGVNLRGANLSGAAALLDPTAWLRRRFKTDELGVLVYKRIGGGHTQFHPPDRWKIEAGAFLTEVVNPDRGSDCGCGVNFGTRTWCETRYTDADLWLCRIRWMDLAGVVVPLMTDGKARCSRLELISPVEEAS